MSVSRMLVDTYNIKSLDCKDIVDYTNCYKIAFNKLLSLINKESWLSRKNIEMSLQGSLLQYLGKSYSFFVNFQIYINR